MIVTKTEILSQKIMKRPFVTLHQWTNLKMSFPNEETLKLAQKNGHYNSNVPLPVDVDVEYGDDGYHRTFLTIPRLSHGIPYSLAIITESNNTVLLNPRVEPYPNYYWHSSHGANCNNITSAIRTFIDDCWRLWIVDSGQINSFQYCAPQILAFDLSSDKLVHRYILPEYLYTPGVSVFTALIVDIKMSNSKKMCEKPFIYVADPWGYGLIVYDAFAGKSWRVEHELMKPDKNLQKSNSANNGIFTVNISPDGLNKGKRFLYFHALNSYKEIGVPLHVINNSTNWFNKRYNGTNDFFVVGNRGTQCESETIDKNGNLYCSIINSNALIGWTQESVYSADTLQVLAYSPEQFKFITGLKINRNSENEEEMWALSNDPKLFVGRPTKSGSTKYQIIGCRIADLLNKKHCTVGANT
ncbi:protein yellow-like [Teleopsis dalmanni]|uniref:protein yellow-like n=1 Tax=Teleopsis dalmanni TaxID=139649 RepID=UPI0018CE0883|nr:protein yellow-like [Teleopsis dalmanni]